LKEELKNLYGLTIHQSKYLLFGKHSKEYTFQFSRINILTLSSHIHIMFSFIGHTRAEATEKLGGGK
jgi:hypothetical protein